MRLCRPQETSSSTQAVFVTVAHGIHAITSGTPGILDVEEGSGCDESGAWWLYPGCGSHLAWLSLDESRVDILAITLDDASLYQPKA